jgi:hypothetical protein
LYYSPKNIRMINKEDKYVTFSIDVFEQLKGRDLLEDLSTDGRQYQNEC